MMQALFFCRDHCVIKYHYQWLSKIKELEIITDNFSLLKLNHKNGWLYVHLLDLAGEMVSDETYKIIKKINDINTFSEI